MVAGVYGWIYTVIQIILSCSSVVLLLIGLFNLDILLRLNLLVNNALSSSLTLAILANLASTVLFAYDVKYPLGPWPSDAFGSKRDFSQAGKVFITMTFLLCSLSYLNISVVWLLAAESASRLKPIKGKLIQRYSLLLGMYSVVFCTLVVASMIIGSYALTVGGALPGAIIILVSYAIGAIRMRRLLAAFASPVMDKQSYSSPFNTNRSSKNMILSKAREAQGKLRTSLEMIQSSAVGISISCAIFIISLGIWAYNGTFIEQPGNSVNLILNSVAFLGVGGSNVFVMRYLHFVCGQKRGPTYGNETGRDLPSPAEYKNGTDDNEPCGEIGPSKDDGVEWTAVSSNPEHRWLHQ